ncbi:Lsr2 family protein [Streptomyces sp. NPDC006632]|uniref:histone-like nucleoid-structuring protein Lsr2 n=1 Tax=Streptomyces sp. NPDC006632 TaxID=3157182 RepID=UPI0033ABD426
MKKTIVTLIDDLNPGAEIEAVETVPFALDGVSYEIDLSAENAHVLRSRLKEFTQAGRIVRGAAKRASRPMTEPAGDGATLSRHQGGTDPAVIGAWAVEKGLREPGQRGRLSNAIKEAFKASQFGNDGPLNDLLKESSDKPATDPANQNDHPIVEAEATHDAEEAQPEPTSDTDLNEAEARKHYRPITRSARMADDKKWSRRTGYGNDRTPKIADWKLTERIASLSEQHLSILGMLAGVLPLGKGNNVSYLKTSDARLENLEFIEQDLNSPHGWTITDFGKYAYEVQSMG